MQWTGTAKRRIHSRISILILLTLSVAGLIPSASASPAALGQPGSQAAVPAVFHPIVLTPPFGGTETFARTAGSTGCAWEQASTPLWFNLTTGSMKWNLNTSARSCAGPGGTTVPSRSYVVDTALMHVPLPFHASGIHNMTWFAWWLGSPWKIGVTVAGSCPTVTVHYGWGNATQGRCSVTTAQAVWGNDSLVDTTTGSVVATFNGPSPPETLYEDVAIDWGCANQAHGGACYSFNSTQSSAKHKDGGNYIGPENPRISVVLNPTHHYAWVAEVLVSSSCEVTGWTSASAYALYNVATLGNGFQFVSITIS